MSYILAFYRLALLGGVFNDIFDFKNKYFLLPCRTGDLLYCSIKLVLQIKKLHIEIYL